MAATARTLSSATKVATNLTKALEASAQSWLKNAGLEAAKISVRSETDHDGDDIVLMEIAHPRTDVVINFYDLRKLDSQLRDLAWDRGEARFLHIRHRYDEKQRVSSER